MKPKQLPGGLSERAFRVGEALEAGVTAARVRSPDLCRPHRGVRLPRDSAAADPAVPDLVRSCRGVLPLLGPGDAFSHLTAAALWALPMPRGWHSRGPHDLHITSLRGRAMRRPGIVGHSADRVERLWIHGLPVVQPLDAWAECAALLRLDDLVAMGDALLGEWSEFRPARLITLEELAQAVSRRNGTRGIRLLREAHELTRPNVRSPGETDLRLLFWRGDLPHFELNAEVRDDAGRWLGVSDFVFREFRLVVEYEGSYHRTDPAQFAKDIERRERFADGRWRMVRVTADHLYRRPAQLLSRMRSLTRSASGR